MPYVVPRQLFPLSSRNAAYYLQTNATFLDATYCPFAHPVACCLELLCPFARSFSTNCAISCETRTHFCEGVAQRIDKQNGVRNQLPPYRRWINSISVIIPSLASQGKALRITSLTIDLNMRTMNVILIMLITVHDGRLLGLFLPQLRKFNFWLTEQYFIFQMKQDIKTS